MSSSAGLTLVEIMVVLVILGVVMATVGSKIFGAGDKAKSQLTKLKLEQLKSDIEQYQLRYNSLPSNLDDLSRCTENTGPGCLPISNQDSIVDAWAQPFIYSVSGRAYEIRSLGADGRDGGEAANYDISIKGP